MKDCVRHCWPASPLRNITPWALISLYKRCLCEAKEQDAVTTWQSSLRPFSEAMLFKLTLTAVKSDSCCRLQPAAPFDLQRRDVRR